MLLQPAGSSWCWFAELSALMLVHVALYVKLSNVNDIGHFVSQAG